jgi:glutamine synthetase
MTASFIERFGLARPSHQDDLERALELFVVHNIHTVLISMCDGSGASRVKAIPRTRFADAVENGVAYQSGVLSLDSAADFAFGTGYDFERVGENFLLLPDCRSAFVSPWHPGTAVVMADPYLHDGRPADAAPRLMLQGVLRRLAQRGLRVTWGWEFEFYTFRPDGDDFVPMTPDSQALHQLRYRQAEPMVEALRQSLGEAGIDLVDAVHEYGPGQLEVNFPPADDLFGVDRAFFFRLAVKEILAKLGVVASFMTKPLNGRSASGCHVHQALYEGDRNRFASDTDAEGVSELLRNWIGGQVRHAAALTALVTQTINGYKRYAPNTFAPSNISWGFENRTTMIRIPLDRGENTRVENRLPEAATNPYVSAAGMLATGLLGLDEGPDEKHFAGENAYALDLPRLPATLPEALAALRADTSVQAMLGEPFVRLYLALKENELRRFNGYVSEWERSEYLELA